ncbi:DUF6191 domain-containing protein [Streptomyces sp. NPDC048411]|uniref:DUF6191 domain-containing protein n=1 Tax=Streptomyces sp. NPDC048411 TaxID=3157206 RepID=UPI003452DAA3
MFNFFEELFAPSRKYAAEEQKRLELTRVDLGTGDPARGPVDLSSGKVTVRVPGPEGTPSPPPPTPLQGPEDTEAPSSRSGPSGD